MKRPKFRLAAVLRVAELREKQREREMLVERAKEAAAQREERERTAAYEVRPVPVEGSAGDFLDQREVEALRARGVQEASLARVAAAERLAASRQDWLRAARRRRSLEQLEERHLAAHAMVAARAAQRALDDLVRIRKDTR